MAWQWTSACSHSQANISINICTQENFFLILLYKITHINSTLRAQKQRALGYLKQARHICTYATAIGSMSDFWTGHFIAPYFSNDKIDPHKGSRRLNSVHCMMPSEIRRDFIDKHLVNIIYFTAAVEQATLNTLKQVCARDWIKGLRMRKMLGSSLA